MDLRSASYDLAIAGGGPAGSACAIVAARAGMRVVLLERGPLPRQKVCGEFVSADGVDTLESLLGTDNKVVRHALRIRRAVFHSSGQTAGTDIQPAAASIARYDLDLALWETAQKAGADCRIKTEVERVARRDNGFVLHTAAGELRAGNLVNAAGRCSKLAPPEAAANGEKWLGIKSHFAAPAGEDAVELYFFSGGYCGVQPVRLLDGAGRLNVCAAVRSDVAVSIEQVFAQHAALWRRSRGWQQADETVATAPLRFTEPVPVRDGILQAGDAAGFIDPFLGDGITLALRSGRIAAEAVGQADSVRSYEQRYRQELLPAFRRARRLRGALRFPNAALALMRLPGVAGFIVQKTRIGGG